MSAAPGILALHGNLGAAADWEALNLPSLRAVDLWGFVSLGFREFAGEVAGPLSAGLDRPILAGYSLGGRLALHALAFFPGRWGGAVIVSSHPGLGCAEDRLARRTSDAIWAERTRSGEWKDFLAQWNAQALFGPMTEALCSRQAVLESRRGEIATAFDTWSLARQEDLRESLAVFSAPVLWITGGNDERFTRIGAEMGGVFPDFRHFIVPGSGHRVLEEAPAEVARAVRERFGIGAPQSL